MSVTRHHADWLSLVEVSGPFVSLPVLQRVFPQGLEGRDPAQAKALRAAYEEWQDNPTAPGKQRAWVMHVLTSLLGYPRNQIAEGQTLPAGLEANMPEMGETLRPDFALVAPAGTDTAGQSQLLIASYPAEQSLDKPVIGKHWKATPATRMMELLHGANVPLGLVTNGEQWMLVYAPRGETTGYTSWYGSLWLDEPITLRAFHSLLGVRRFFGVAADSTLLALLKESANDQQEVTDQLGYQVREAVEVLVQSFDALDKESNRILLKGIRPANLYDSALTVMMRLVFLFSAEERGLLHLGKPLYDDNYAVSTLQEQLQEVADRYGEEVLERRSDAWARLLATFRAVHGGIQHQDLLMQAYGGSLFDPDRYPFLEGRAAGSQWRSTPAEPLSVNNRVVLHLLNSLQRLRTKVGAGTTAETRRVSFRALGVEQIGHVYEGLLDHTAFRADEVFLGIKGTRKKEPEIPLAALEAHLAQGEEKLFAFLKEPTGRTTVSPIKREFQSGSLLDEHKLLIACDQDETLLNRLRPFAGLIRDDSFDRPWVVLPGSVFVTAGTTRRSTGTHYTPPSLTEPIVQHTLEPLVYVGPAEGLPREQWKLKSPKEILDLKVCDMAMGSGAFLVQACRYLAERLVEAWENEEKAHPGQVLITPDGKFSEGSPSERLVPAEAAERVGIARRVVADRCLYGVDINPMAVEMAKLSMWLITVDANRPFTFLDHAFKCGDSLLGITSLEQLERFSLHPGSGMQRTISTFNLRQHIDEAKKKREMLEAMPSDTPEQIAAKVALYAEAEEAVFMLNAAADVLVSLELKGLKGKAYDAERETTADRMMACWATGLTALHDYAQKLLGGRRCLHWALTFPENISRGGFSAFIGNPPFIGGHDISGLFGYDYRTWLSEQLYGGKAGLADICAFFVARCYQMTAIGGSTGLVATNSITEGDSRKVGLEKIVQAGAKIIHAWPDMPWPGNAAVVVSPFVIFRGDWGSPTYSSWLRRDDNVVVHALGGNKNLCFVGCYVLGKFFELEGSIAKKLIDENPMASNVVLPYINGIELNSTPSLIPRRWIICFWDWPESKSRSIGNVFQHLEKEYKDAGGETTQRNWWLFARSRPALYHALNLGERFIDHPLGWLPGSKAPNMAIVKAKTSETWAFAFMPSNTIFDQALTVFASDDPGLFATAQSTVHEIWARLSGTGSKMKTDLRYAPTTFEAFPLPPISEKLREHGVNYHLARNEVMVARSEGLTEIYNHFHDPKNTVSDINMLRHRHAEMDQVVAAAYGWQDIDLGHGFHETKQGIRFTISEAARREVLDRLLALNHQRYAEEVEAGLHDKKAQKAVTTETKRSRKKKDTSNPTPRLFD